MDVNDETQFQGSVIPSVGGDLLMRISSIAPRLPATAMAVARQVLDDPAAVMTSSIADLAARSGTSTASVTRFCQAIGLSGYPELRLRLASEIGGKSPQASWGRDVGSDIEVEDSVEQVASVIAGAHVLAIQRSVEQLDAKAIAQAADAIVLAGRVDLYGTGGSSLVAQELQFRLHRIGRPAWCFPEFHAAMMSASLHREGDVFFGISRSGRTIEVVDALAEARSHGATTICLTSFPASPLAEVADIVLTTPVQDSTVRHGSLAARQAQLLVVDCLYSVVAQRTYLSTTDALARTSSALASRRGARSTRRSPKHPGTR